ncbi:MAG: hypothetical protein K5872_17915 [Rhizobiaceae bacterium]|nr:hypothetical protein [Rhizobiaceae bacterium]MCV0408102.1 hypothetical protein [Rhizobiaceae bacterium]
MNPKAEAIFRPLPGPKSKGDTTTEAARAIIDAEEAARLRKTEKLKRLREIAEAEAAPVEPAPKRPKARVAAKKAPAKKIVARKPAG